MSDATNVVAGSGFKRDIRLIFQVYDTTTPDRAGSYLAGPISTGRRFYQALANTGAGSFDELVAVLGGQGYWDQVRGPNVADGNRLADALRAGGVPHVVFTGAIHLDDWAGADYMTLCFRLIEAKIRRLYFHPDWAFSSGAVQEYAFAYERGYDLFRADGRPLRPDEAVAALEASTWEIERLGLSAAKQRERTDRVKQVVYKPTLTGSDSGRPTGARGDTRDRAPV